uniref:Uncharacterized protein n=1 Tax=Craspedostauros australis TaxID=1486917 RepID=A0A7R9ZK45_9STRA
MNGRAKGVLHPHQFASIDWDGPECHHTQVPCNLNNTNDLNDVDLPFRNSCSSFGLLKIKQDLGVQVLESLDDWFQTRAQRFRWDCGEWHVVLYQRGEYAILRFGWTAIVRFRRRGGDQVLQR